MGTDLNQTPAAACLWGGREFRLGPPVIAALTRAVALTLTSTTEVEQRLHMKWRRRKLPSDAGGS